MPDFVHTEFMLLKVWNNSLLFISVYRQTKLSIFEFPIPLPTPSHAVSNKLHLPSVCDVVTPILTS